MGMLTLLLLQPRDVRLEELREGEPGHTKDECGCDKCPRGRDAGKISPFKEFWEIFSDTQNAKVNKVANPHLGHRIMIR